MTKCLKDNGGISQFVTPFSYVPFEFENEKPTGDILEGDVVVCEKLKKIFSMIKQGCFTLATKLNM